MSTNHKKLKLVLSAQPTYHPGPITNLSHPLLIQSRSIKAATVLIQFLLAGADGAKTNLYAH